MSTQKKIELRKVCVHNLKSVDLSLPVNELVVFTGVSGSGKSSLAFDTLFVEGQRRYVESLSTHARRYLGDMSKPDAEHIEGVSPTISIEQKTAGNNPRSTVGTLTEIYDYLRVLFARVGEPHCPVSGEKVAPQSRESIIRAIQGLEEGCRIMIFAPYARGKKAEFKEDFQDLLRKGFMRVRVDGQIMELGEDIALDGALAHDVDIVIDRLVVKESAFSRISEAVSLALELGAGLCETLNADTKESTLYSMHAYSPKSGLSYPPLEPHDFSFNSPSGMCSRCGGLGEVSSFDLDKVIDPEKSIAEDCCSIASSYETVRFGNIYNNLARIYRFDVHTPWKSLSKKAKAIFLHGADKKWLRMHFIHPVKGSTWSDYVHWQGVLHEAQKRYTEAKSQLYRTKMERLMSRQRCPECEGARLKAYPAATLIRGQRIHDLCQMTVEDALHFFDSLSLEGNAALIASELLKEIRQRLFFLMDVGLHYLALDRTAPTLSGGEAQRVRLASQIGCGLVGVTYILDEPSIGLHPRDNLKLIQTLKHLRDKGNTVIVVEHDEETMWAADRIIDFGPGPGSRGGEIVVNGSLKKLLKSSRSLTSAYLTGRKCIPIPKKRRKAGKEKLKVKGAAHHNLKNLSVTIPLGLFVAVTGVSGSGKSSLITDILHPALANHLHRAEQAVGFHKSLEGVDAIDKVISIDQSAIGRNPRSNPSTYIKVFDDIRDLFTKLPESRARGYKAGRFSFNVKEGSCPHCSGMGQVKVDMDFMEAAWVDCDLCKGRRFDRETLSVLYKGKNIYDILEMEVGEALVFFENIPQIHHKLQTLAQVGMEYIKLGQASTTLSGGEAQRIKLAKELVRPATGRTLYILDEPTTGLHFHDIQHLLTVLHTLVDHGNTVLVIEHNMDVVKTADWILDLGPEGGAQGGTLVAEGVPEKLAKMSTPTGTALDAALNPRYIERMEEVELAQEKLKAERKENKKEQIHHIHIKDAGQNNLKQVCADIPRNKLTVCTGPSGSGKTSLAFETIYAEGQRRYAESLSPYARQFVKQMPKPKVGEVDGLSPAIAIEQKLHAGNPRSTVGTMTEIYDYLRVLYARVGIPHCPETGERIQAISKDHVVDKVMTYPKGAALYVLAPLELRKSESFEEVVTRLNRQGYLRIRLNGTYHRLDEDIPYSRKRKNALFLVCDRLKISPSIKSRLEEAVENAVALSGGTVTIDLEGKDTLFNLAFAVESTGKSYSPITPQTFAFNTLEGMCPECQGLGYQYGAQLTDSGEIMELSFVGLLQGLWADLFNQESLELIKTVMKKEKIDLYSPLNSLSSKKLSLLMNGSEQLYKAPSGFNFRWLGINPVLAKAGKAAHSEIRQGILPLLDEITCFACEGSRVNALARHVTIQKNSIGTLCNWPIAKALDFLEKIQLKEEDKKLLDATMQQLLCRLHFLKEVGLHYISLDRRAPTLSGGESQRIRLARQLGTGLTGVLYVLDEPTIGLHPRDTHRLHQALDKLKALNNTLIMVEHDPYTVAMADYLLDFGPSAGSQGGEITAAGTLKQIQRNPQSLTGQYLNGEKCIPLPKKRRQPKSKACIQVKKASVNNLKKLSVSFPIGVLNCLTGVSGSGKSTLLHQVLWAAWRRLGGAHEDASVSGLEHFDQAIVIDQNPIGLTARATVASYVDVLTPLRRFFAMLPEARARGLSPKNFSFNHRQGMCTNCWGLGYRRVEMHFLPAVRVVCEDCKGLRLNSRSLEVKYTGRNLGELLQLTVDELLELFCNVPPVKRILTTLSSVGLGYLRLGQQMATLSGGEAQRIKLSRELHKRSRGKTLYLLDEPTTGLHSDDIHKLLKVLHKLVDKGNTMIIIEHNLDMIKNADYIVDIGPEGGSEGGKLTCAGSPEEVAEHPLSHTGHFLKPLI